MYLGNDARRNAKRKAQDSTSSSVSLSSVVNFKELDPAIQRKAAVVAAAAQLQAPAVERETIRRNNARAEAEAKKNRTA